MKGYRTYLVNFAIAALTAGFATFDPQTVADLLGSKWGPLGVVGVSAVNMLLRSFTNTAPGRAA